MQFCTCLGHLGFYPEFYLLHRFYPITQGKTEVLHTNPDKKGVTGTPHPLFREAEFLPWIFVTFWQLAAFRPLEPILSVSGSVHESTNDHHTLT